uniref:Translocase of outer mitochondrial membrane 20 n=1 Tax=Astatotilapia calliptera TaxID=8154 RepID=A0AAX7V6I3_ASTCA
MMGGRTSAIAAGVCGALFVGYCIYFDRKRRNDPNFKNRLRERDYEKGVDHLTNAIAVCGQPQQLLQVLQQTLPPPVFQMLLTKLPSISQRIVSAQSLSEDDIE